MSITRPVRRPVAANPLLEQVLIGLEVFLWVTSSAALLFVAWSSTSRLAYQLSAAEELALRPHALPTVVGERDAIVVKSWLAPGTPVARLRIPRLGIDAIVAEGDTEEVLSRAVGRIPGSALPGAGGNVALAAHRDSFFRPLRDLRVGDRLELHSNGAVRLYRVAWTAVVDPDRLDVVAPTAGHAVTLVTCYPFRYIGSAPHRFIARAEPIGEPVTRRPAPIVSGG